jgi:hypothetical protein
VDSLTLADTSPAIPLRRGCLHKPVAMSYKEFQHLADLCTAHASASVQSYRLKPELANAIFALDVDMRRLIPIAGIEEESIRPVANDG